MTNELPEMRASDAERERIAESLREAVAEGRLDMAEFEHRLDAAYKARTHSELEPLVRDLPAPARSATAPAPQAGDGWAARVGGPATSSGAFAMWGGFNRRGAWTVAARFTAFAMFGGGKIDLREARFEGGDVVIRCFALMGGISVVVPPSCTATSAASASWGPSATRRRAPALRGRPGCASPGWPCSAVSGSTGG